MWGLVPRLRHVRGVTPAHTCNCGRCRAAGSATGTATGRPPFADPPMGRRGAAPPPHAHADTRRCVHPCRTPHVHTPAHSRRAPTRPHRCAPSQWRPPTHTRAHRRAFTRSRAPRPPLRRVTPEPQGHLKQTRCTPSLLRHPPQPHSTPLVRVSVFWRRRTRGPSRTRPTAPLGRRPHARLVRARVPSKSPSPTYAPQHARIACACGAGSKCRVPGATPHDYVAVAPSYTPAARTAGSGATGCRGTAPPRQRRAGSLHLRAGPSSRGTGVRVIPRQKLSVRTAHRTSSTSLACVPLRIACVAHAVTGSALAVHPPPSVACGCVCVCLFVPVLVFVCGSLRARSRKCARALLHSRLHMRASKHRHAHSHVDTPDANGACPHAPR